MKSRRFKGTQDGFDSTEGSLTLGNEEQSERSDERYFQSPGDLTGSPLIDHDAGIVDVQPKGQHFGLTCPQRGMETAKQRLVLHRSGLYPIGHNTDLVDDCWRSDDVVRDGRKQRQLPDPLQRDEA
jgi:hypothetical protein